MCKALLEWGADPSTETWDRWQQLPIATVGSDSDRTPNPDDMIDTFRAILEYHDFESTSSESNGGNVLANLAFNTCKIMESSALPILWLLQISARICLQIAEQVITFSPAFSLTTGRLPLIRNSSAQLSVFILLRKGNSFFLSAVGLLNV